jgi:DNA helicase HerA-like ATPase
MLPDSQPILEQEIANYERHMLDSLGPAAVDPSEMLAGHDFVHIRGISNFWDSDTPVDYLQHVIDFVISAHGYRDYLTFVLAGAPAGIDIYLSLKDHKTASNLLVAAFPGLTLDDKPVAGLDSVLRAHLTNPGMLSGIPSRKRQISTESAQSEVDFYHLERIVRGMRDTSWTYVVQAYPRPTEHLLEERKALLEKLANLSSMTRGQIQKSTQESKVRTKQETTIVSEMMGGEIINRRAEYVVELLEHELERLDVALAIGRWQVAVYFGAAKMPDTRRLASLLQGIMAGPDSRPDPLRTHTCQLGQGGSKPEQFNTYLTSEELALLIRLPREEAPGYAVNDLATFDVDFKPPQGRRLDLGKIQWNGSDSGQRYAIQVDDLTRHGVVFGVTGSGKTTSLLSLLYQLRNSKPTVPFLVIEPAKTEYRALLGYIENGTANGPISDLQLFTLGSDTVSPFRLNPFEFDLGATPGRAAVLSHIDFLKAVFNAAFILYAPMPYVLETALHEIYEDKGWNLATETNVRLSDDDWLLRDRYPIFPTLTDLYNKVEQVTARLGYETRVEQDVIAGLKARLGAMRLGAKGLMLDTPRGIPLTTLLTKPVVLEMENIGNDDEKTFLIGLLLARLYGYRRLQAVEGNLPEGLQHILIIEEAHRLLKNVNTQVDTESSNLRAQAIETFVNMLSEVRHYGQGVLVAEQIPSKLTPDVIKNTNLKIVHRLLAQDDRQLVGFTMNMSEAQIKRLATLQPGEAAVFSESDDHAVLLRVDNFKAVHRLKVPSSDQVPALVERYTSLSPYLITPDFASYGLRIVHFGGPDPIVYQTAMNRVNRWDSARIWGRMIARTIFARNMLLQAIDQLRQRIASDPGQLPLNLHGEGLVMLIVMGAAQALEARGVENGWSYSSTEAMRLSLTAGLIKLTRLNDLKASAYELDRFVRAYEASLKREWGPYPGCHACRAVCLYRSEVRRLLSLVDYGHIKDILADTKYSTEKERYEALRSTLRGIVKQWLGGESAEMDDIGYCAALVTAPSIGLDEYEQADMGRKLASQMLA